MQIGGIDRSERGFALFEDPASQADGKRMRPQTFCLRHDLDGGTVGSKPFRGVADNGRALHEIIHGQRIGESRRAARRKRMVRPGDVVS